MFFLFPLLKTIFTFPLPVSSSISWFIVLVAKRYFITSQFYPYLFPSLFLTSISVGIFEVIALNYESIITCVNFYDSASSNAHYWIYSEGSTTNWTRPGLAAFESYRGNSPHFINHLPLTVTPPSLNEVPGYRLNILNDYYFIQIDPKSLIYPTLRGMGFLVMSSVITYSFFSFVLDSSNTLLV